MPRRSEPQPHPAATAPHHARLDRRSAALVNATNLSGAFYVGREAGLRMRDRHGGHIVNIASDLAFTAMPGYTDYSASKAGVVGLTRGLAVELAPTLLDGRRNAASAAEHGITYLDGAMMAYPRSIGTDDAVLLFSGAEETFASHRTLLGALGKAEYVGDDAGQPAVIDAALIAFFYGTLSGFLHGAILSRAQGSEIERYLELARPFFAGFITNAVNETGDRIAAGRYGDAQSSMHTHLGGIDLLVVGSSREAGIDYAVMDAIKDFFQSAVDAGRGDDDIAVLLEVATDEGRPGN